MSFTDTLNELVALSNRIGRPELDYVMMGEGNTSARLGDGTFWVKSSGTELRTITAAGFVRVVMDRALAVADGPELNDEQITTALNSVKSDPAAPGRPSVETLLHAQLLALDGIRFVAHAHPTVVNALTCSVGFPDVLRGRLCPEEIVFCGKTPLLVPYADPGLPLVRRLKSVLKDYLKDEGVPPRVIYMQNHGLVALGGTVRQVEDTMAMAVKMARVLLGTYAVGGPRFLAGKDVTRIDTRPDEHYRQKQREG